MRSRYRTFGDEGGPLYGGFLPWAYMAAGHFVFPGEVWRDEDIASCCVALGIEPPGSLPYLESTSEDEMICSRSGISLES